MPESFKAESVASCCRVYVCVHLRVHRQGRKGGERTFRPKTQFQRLVALHPPPNIIYERISLLHSKRGEFTLERASRTPSFESRRSVGLLFVRREVSVVFRVDCLAAAI